MCIYEAEKQARDFMCPLQDKIFREKHVPVSINTVSIACASYSNNNKYSSVKDNFKFAIDFDYYSTLNDCRMQQSQNHDVDQYSETIFSQFE